ncbi:MAG: hypothetical protein AAF599_18475, partial [Bacteroidota bacterium]
MELSITNVPTWVSLLFIFSFLTPIYLIAKAAKNAYLKAGKSTSEAQGISRNIYVFYIAYLIFIAVLSLLGVFAENTLPPRILILGALPLLLFYFLYVNRSAWFKIVLKNAPLSDLVRIHLFRFVGIFFFINYYYGTLPKQFAFTGGGGDILTALLAIWVIYALNHQKKYAISLTWIWNIIGLVDIISVLLTAIIITREAVATNGEGVAQFGTFPFSWIPAFAPATILFLHAIIFRRLRQGG